MRVVLVLLTVVTQLVVAVAGFLVLLLALNGYSERQAMPALLVYVALCLVVVIGSAVFAPLAAKQLLAKKRLGTFGAGAVTTIAFTMLGALLILINLFISAGVAELRRGLR